MHTLIKRLTHWWRQRRVLRERDIARQREHANLVAWQKELAQAKRTRKAVRLAAQHEAQTKAGA